VKSKFKAAFNFVKDVFEKWIDDKAPKLGASLSFYTIFSLAPLLIISVALAGLFFGEEAARGEIVGQISGLVGEESAVVIETALKSSADRETGIIALIISIITLTIGSTFVFIELQDSLDMIWKVKPKPGRSMIKGLIKDRLISFSIVIVIGFLLLVSLLISAVISALSNYIDDHLFFIPIWVLELTNVVFSFGIIFILFAMVYKILPDVHIAWSDVWIGAAVTAALFVIGKFLIGLYLGTSTVASTYGAAGSLVILLLWIYYSAQILFLGAEFTQVYANKYGTGIKPTANFMKYSNEHAVSEKTEDDPKKEEKSD
jgi:membrane protein